MDQALPATAGDDSGIEPLGPVDQAGRIVTLDVVRGVALLGLLLANLPFFAFPIMEFQNLVDLGAGASPLDVATFVFVKVFVEFKFLSLFSILFGAGLIIQMNRARERGARFTRLYVRRLLFLACLGLAHALLIWYGDILFIYAVTGFVLLMLAALGWKWLMALAALSFALGQLFLAAILGVTFMISVETGDDPHVPTRVETTQSTVPATGEPIDDRWDRFMQELPGLATADYIAAWTRAELIAYGEGPLLAAGIIRAITFMVVMFFAGILAGVWLRTLALFLLGAALVKLGFFDPCQRRWHRRLAIAGLGLGLPLEALVGFLYVRHGFDVMAPAVLGAEGLHYLSSMLLCLGYLGCLCLFVQSGAAGRLVAALAAVGRMALSNYILQSLAATFVFYWWGLGLFNQLSRFEQLAVVAAVLPAQVVFSVLWLRAFRFGPLEWLWRSATYWKFQPLRRSP